MFGNCVSENSKMIQRKSYSKDFRHKYLITEIVLFGKVISKSVIEIPINFENNSK